MQIEDSDLDDITIYEYEDIVNIVNSYLDDNLTNNNTGNDSGNTGDIIQNITNVTASTKAILIEDIPTLKISGDTLSQLTISKNSVDAIYIFEYKNRIMNTGYCNIKYQGNSSLSYPKKNYTIKLYSDKNKGIDNKMNFNYWGNENKFVLKANYIDHSHARNIISARLWADICKTRSNTLPEQYVNSPNFGAIDGFPIKLYKNGTYEGLYTLNIPKDGWLFGMTESDGTQSVLCSENYQSGCFNAAPVINGNDWSLEYPKKLSNTIKTSWTNAIAFVMSADETNFADGIGNYFDVDSLIDYYIYAYVSCGIDSLGKNQIYITYNNGETWYASMYDMDSTWGLYWNGSKFLSSSLKMQDGYESMCTTASHPEDGNQLYRKLELYLADRIKIRYAELRETVLSEEYIVGRFEQFMNQIPEDLYAQDVQIYTGIPSKSVDHLGQIKSFVPERLAYVDEQINNLA